LYLAADAWAWPGWIIVGMAGWLMYVVLGEPLTGRELREMRALVAGESGVLSQTATDRLRRPRMLSAVVSRAGLGLGIVFCMAVKPSAVPAAAAVVVGALAGLAVARLTSRPRRADASAVERSAER
jgi:hypothetical protein